jgi:peptidoglycan hydrolase-like protein with peptidoglycan-binding domain
MMMQQGYTPPQPAGDQPRTRRTQRYEQQNIQPPQPSAERLQPDATQPELPAVNRYPNPSVGDFPQRERVRYQSGSPYPQGHSTAAQPQPNQFQTDHMPKRKKQVVLWSVIAVLFILVAVAGNGLRNADEPTQADTSAEQTVALSTAASATVAPTAATTATIAPTATVTAVPRAYDTLSQGSSGAAVALLQQRLIDLGYLDDAADGIFGNKTCAAVKSFQSQNGLISTGIADSDTLTYLYTAGAKTAAIATATPKTASASDAAAVSGTTASQKNALSAAKAYLSFTAFSYEGLIDQLEYEQYSHSDAVYAADRCGADWKEQALLSAKSYLNYTAFSYTGLIEQLEYEGFTSSQATYGADRCGANWKEQAALSAKAYLRYMTFSRSDLIDQLEYEGFTHSQAVYGVDASGL